MSLGGYEFPTRPDPPIPVHLGRAACQPGLDARRQHDAGRVELFTTSFEDYERATRDQLARMLGPSGFDPARDVAAIWARDSRHVQFQQLNRLQNTIQVIAGDPRTGATQVRFTDRETPGWKSWRRCIGSKAAAASCG